MNIMKKILSMLVFALPLVLFSCSKDEPQATNNNQSVPAVEEDEITYFMCAAQAKAWQGKDTVAVFEEIKNLGFLEEERYVSSMVFRKDIDNRKYTINIPFNNNIVRSVTINMECFGAVYTQAAIADSVILYAGQVKRALANQGYRFAGSSNFMWTDPDPNNPGQDISDWQHFGTYDEFVAAVRALGSHASVDFTSSAYANDGIGTEVHGHYDNNPGYQELHISFMKQ